MDIDSVVFSSLIVLHIVLVVWVHRARPPESVLGKYPTIPVIISWVYRPSIDKVGEPPPEEKLVLLRYRRRVIIQFWCVIFTVIFMMAYIYFSVGHIQQ
jgi:hypothetical protein